MTSKVYKYTFIAIIGLLLLSNRGLAQDKDSLDNYRFYFKFNTVKQADSTRLLKVEYTARNKKDRKDIVPVYGAEIQFYNVADDEDLSLGTATTNKEGIAKLSLSKDQQYSTGEDGYITVKAQFDGSDALDAEEEELTFKDLHLVFNLEEIDSVKTISTRAYTLDSLDTEIPVDEADINFYIGGMLSKMKIEEGSLSDGEYEFELQNMVPGDKDGNVTYYAMIEDNDDYGTVIAKQTMKWGTGQIAGAPQDDHMLWSEAAPYWMYIVLTIMLLGVWINYVYTVINLIKIKKETKNIEVET
ncbi:MAG: hypothetical protein KDC69_07835 [Flavobacteriaceae bacterium]|nr:hypothetical protein [Flavobacteriaceae bacterium]